MVCRCRLPLSILLSLYAAATHSQEGSAQYFRIEVIDGETGRGVPLIELSTTYGGRYVTDSAGVVAFHEPGLMGEQIWFGIDGHGYAYPADGFGFRGVRLSPTPGGEATIAVDRTQLAERLYRITGVGLYRDSLLLGEPAPLAEPAVNAQITGQDSALAHIYDGRIHWFWGDTGRLAYPLGLFKAAGATSLLPADGGLPPSRGVALEYFTGADGFARNMAPVPGEGVVWLDGLHSAPDADGRLRMFAHYERRDGLAEVYETGIVVWNDATSTFERFAELDRDEPLHPIGRQPIVQTVDGTEYLVFATPFPNLRVPRRLDAIVDPARYEGYTPLVAGTRFAGAATQLERGADGALVWAWKRGTAPLRPSEQRELVELGRIDRNASPFRLVEADTGRDAQAHSGTVAWNDYIGRWIMVFGRLGGDDALLGEVMIAAADALEGPWADAVTIAGHDAYSFYNVAQRPFFDTDGGREIYFEGTYTRTFSATAQGTPYYDYNQIMYRLDLSAAFRRSAEQ